MNETRGSRERVAILLNPSAGRGKAGKNRDRLAALFRTRGIPHELHVTGSEAHLRELARHKSLEFGTLAAAGGDSTFQIVAEEIVKAGASPRLAMFGLGSSNDITREFGLETLEKTMAALEEGRTRRIDLGSVESEGAAPRYFIGQASIGLGVFVNQAAARAAERTPGLAGLQIAVGIWGVARAFRKKLVPVSLAVAPSPGGKVEGRFQVANFANIRFWATGRRLVPQARPDDGMLDACLIREGSFLRLARLASSARKGRQVRMAGVEFLRSPVFDISSETPFAIQVDGEVLGGTFSPTLFGRVRVRVMPGALTIIA
jgi:diacylglycerol kinase family enzyme